MISEILLPPDWGKAWLNKAGAYQNKGVETARSYDHFDNQLVWEPGSVCNNAIRFACDVENQTRHCADIAKHFGLQQRQFLRQWVITEVSAKLLNIPILQWLKLYGLLRDFSENHLELDVQPYGVRGKAILFIKDSQFKSIIVAFGFLSTES